MRRLIATAVLATTLATTTTACGDDEPAPTGSGDTASFDITFEGDQVTPSGAEESVEQGSDIELVVQADKPGELHVHSSPEQELEYDAGTTTIPVKLSNQPPGVIDIESHDLDVVVIRLTIS